MPGLREGRLTLLTSLRRALPAPVLMLALALVAVPAAASGGPYSAPPAAHVSRVEDEIVGCTNRARLAHGLPALRRSSVLRHAAKYHARNMLHYDFFRHNDVFGQSPADRVARFGRRGVFRWVGENIAVGYWSAADVCRAWMASHEHRSNILSRHYTMIGVGYAKAGDGRTYFVQDFGSHGAR
jgi:uncharacterized protein YkwD